MGKLYVIGDKSTGVCFVTLDPLRAALIQRSKIEEFAQQQGKTFAQVFGDIAKATQKLISNYDPTDGLPDVAEVPVAIGGMVARGTTITDAEFCFVADVSTAEWFDGRENFMPLEAVITHLTSAPPSAAMGVSLSGSA